MNLDYVDHACKKLSPNILLIEAYTDANIGSCALVENSLKILENKFRQSEIRIMAQYPEAFRHLYNKLAIQDIFKYPSRQPRLRQLLWLFKTLGWMTGVMIMIPCMRRRLLVKNISLIEKIRPFLWADMIISVGGERLNDKFYKNIIFSLYTYVLSKVLDKKMILFPQTIGPFFFLWSKWLTKKVLKRIDLIYTRDHASTYIVCNELGVPEEKVVNAIDVAILQEPIRREKALSLIPAKEEDILVGISTMRWSYFKNRIQTPYSNYNAYVTEMAAIADTLIEKYNVTIVFYPTNFPIHGSRDDDAQSARQIFSLMKNKQHARIITKLRTPAEFQGMLSCSQINITTRMHACILSTTAYVPVISVNYLFKLREYMDSLGLGEFSIDIEEFCAEKAIKAFNLMWPERDTWVQHLKVVVDQKRRLLWKAMEALDALASR